MELGDDDGCLLEISLLHVTSILIYSSTAAGVLECAKQCTQDRMEKARFTKYLSYSHLSQSTTTVLHTIDNGILGLWSRLEYGILT